MITTSIKDHSVGAGLVVSIGLHIALILLVILGLPIFWQPDPLPEVIGIQMATQADITAAPKAPKDAPQVKKGADTPKVEQKQPPKVDTPPPVEKQAATPPPAPAPTPPQPETKPAEQPKPEEAEVIPDKTKQPDKKPDEKKPEPPKPQDKPKPDTKPKPDKPKKDTSDQDLNALLNNVLKDQPAPDSKADKPKPAAPAPQQDASEAPKTDQFSELPLTASEADGIAKQVHDKWNIGSLDGAPDLDKLNVTFHITLQPDGTITGITYDNDQPGNPRFRIAAESAKRAFQMMKKIQLPPGKTYEKITFIFQPALMH